MYHACVLYLLLLACRYEQYVEDAYVDFLKQHNKADEVNNQLIVQSIAIVMNGIQCFVY